VLCGLFLRLAPSQSQEAAVALADLLVRDGVSVEDINVVFMNRQPGQAEGQDGQDQHTDDNSREHDHTLNNSGVIFFCGAP